MAGSLIFEAGDLYWPSRSLLELRRLYLEEKRKEWREKLGKEVRINIMYARRRWYFLWLARAFEWTWNNGFDPPAGHIDANMWICEFQGVCGKAFRTMKPQTVYFDEQVPPFASAAAADAASVRGLEYPDPRAVGWDESGLQKRWCHQP